MTTASETTAQRGPPAAPLLEVRHLSKAFPVRGGLLGRTIAHVRAVDDVSFVLHAGEVLAVVGESGSGKSTVAQLLMHLVASDRGSIHLDGAPVGAKGGMSVRQLRRAMQMVFQDSYSALNPRLTVFETLVYGPRSNRASRRAAAMRAEKLLDEVGLDPARFAARYPHELSGGQRQRVNIARALSLDPRIVILDEAVSALDKSIEAQILNLLVTLKRERELQYIFISHDLNVVEYVSDRVIVMYLGAVVEQGPTEAIFSRPQHPYTRALLSSKPTIDPRRRTTELPIQGEMPNPMSPPSGCRFRTRCPVAQDICAAQPPKPIAVDAMATHQVACHIADPLSSHPRTAGTPA
ncbi:MAG: ATP-binding cassette domain-containing protein [Hyphomicrobiales bacterium]|nr:ATP-binding cassette domain-containing protein [Hyphomicrobiales bacterium]